jgi:hypothetical protein
VLLVAGAVAITVTSACYALTSPVLSMPIPSARVGEALAAAIRGAPIFELGGAVGVLGDVMFAAAAFVVAMHARRGSGRVGWVLAGVCSAVFIGVDAIAARALVPGPAFAVIKGLFDMMASNQP